MADYGFTKEFAQPFDAVVERVTVALQKEGFGVLSTIDVREKLREKLGVDFPRYLILGACSPRHAQQVLSEDPQVGLFLPCNTVVYEKGGKTVVSILKPTEAMKVVQNPKLEPIAREVESKLERVFKAI